MDNNFSGGISDKLDSPNQAQAENCDNYLITRDQEIETRPGSEVISGTITALVTAGQTGELINYLDSVLFVGATDKLFYNSAGVFTALSGASGVAFPGGVTSVRQLNTVSYLEQLFFVGYDSSNSTYITPQKLYYNEAGSPVILDAGLPAFPDSQDATSKSTLLAAAITLANSLKTKINAHFASMSSAFVTFTANIAAPMVITKVAHGLSDGDIVIFSDNFGTTALPTSASANTLDVLVGNDLGKNGYYYVVRNKTADTFNVASLGNQDYLIDSTSVGTAGQAYKKLGAHIGSSGVASTAIAAANATTEATLITLLTEMRSKINSHVQDARSGNTAAPNHQPRTTTWFNFYVNEELPDATDLNSCIDLLNDIKEVYNYHIDAYDPAYSGLSTGALLGQNSLGFINQHYLTGAPELTEDLKKYSVPEITQVATGTDSLYYLAKLSDQILERIVRHYNHLSRAVVASNSAGDMLFTTTTNHQLYTGDSIYFFASGAPTNITLNSQIYFVTLISSTTFKVSTTLGGAFVAWGGAAGAGVFFMTDVEGSAHLDGYVTTGATQSEGQSGRYPMYERHSNMARSVTGARCVASAANDTFTSQVFYCTNFNAPITVPHNLKLGDSVVFLGRSIPPTGIFYNTIYYVSEIPTTSTFKIAATPTGASIDITAAEQGAMYYRPTVSSSLRQKQQIFKHMHRLLHTYHGHRDTEGDAVTLYPHPSALSNEPAGSRSSYAFYHSSSGGNTTPSELWARRAPDFTSKAEVELMYTIWIDIATKMDAHSVSPRHVSTGPAFVYYNYSASPSSIIYDYPYTNYRTMEFGSFSYAFTFTNEYKTNKRVLFRDEGTPFYTDTIVLPTSVVEYIYPAIVFTPLSTGAFSRTLNPSNFIFSIPALSGTNSPSTYKRGIYRTTDSGDVFYKVTETLLSSYEDTTSDTNLISNETLYTTGGVADNDQAPKSRVAALVKNKMYYGSIVESTTYNSSGSTYTAYNSELKNRIRVSKAQDLDSCPATFFEDIQADVVTIGSAREIPIVVSSNGVYRLEDTLDDLGNGSLTAVKIDDTVSGVSATSGITVEDAFFFMAKDGFYMSDAYKVSLISKHLFDRYPTLVSDDARKRSVRVTYDKIGKRIYWAVNTTGAAYCDSIYCLDLNWGISEEMPFTTWSNSTHFTPQGVVFFQDVLHRGDRQGFVFKHTAGLKSDPKIDRTGSGSLVTGVTVYIPFSFRSISDYSNSNTSRKYATRLKLVFDNLGDLSILPQSMNDRNTSNVRDLDAIRFRSTATNAGYITETRTFPKATDATKNAGGLRFLSKQVGLVPSLAILFASDDTTILTKASSSGSTVTLAGTKYDGSVSAYTWPLDIADYWIYFETDSYATAYPIVTRNSNSQITVTGTPAATAAKWVIKGYSKLEKHRLKTLSMLNAVLDGDTHRPQTGNDGENT